MPRTEKYFIGPGLLSDIRQTITRVAGMPDKTQGATFRVGNLDMPPRRGGGGGGLEAALVTFTGTWSRGSTRGLAVQGDTTAAVRNDYINLNPSSECDAVAVRVSNVWQLVQVDFGVQPGYSGTVTQVLGHDASGNAMWISTITCSTNTTA
jgi:hypothetical protein